MLYNVFNKKRDSSAATETISGSIHSKTIYSLSILLICEIVKFRRYIMESIVNELSRRCCKSERFIVLLIKICEDNNIKDASNYIQKFLMKCVK